MFSKLSSNTNTPVPLIVPAFSVTPLIVNVPLFVIVLVLSNVVSTVISLLLVILPSFVNTSAVTLPVLPNVTPVSTLKFVCDISFSLVTFPLTFVVPVPDISLANAPVLRLRTPSLDIPSVADTLSAFVVNAPVSSIVTDF